MQISLYGLFNLHCVSCRQKVTKGQGWYFCWKIAKWCSLQNNLLLTLFTIKLVSFFVEIFIWYENWKQDKFGMNFYSKVLIEFKW